MANDPRALNCRHFALGPDGRVVGVELRYHEQPSTRYALRSAILIGEEEAQGRHVATCWVEDASGNQVTERVGMAYPYQGQPTGMPNVAWPGGTNTQPVQHVVSNGYNPPALGPMAIAIYSQDGQIISDVIASIGLPMGHHVSYDFVWRERSGEEDAPPAVPPDTVLTVLLRIESKLDRALAAG